MANLVEGGKTPALSSQQLAELGFSIAAYPLTLLSAAMRAMTLALKTLESGGDTAGQLMDFAELSDVETLKRLFDTFSRKRFMLKLLDKSINADGVQVFIGRESGYQILDNCSVVTAPYHVDDDHIGVLGVIGPTRMAYDRVVPIVDITARILESALKPGTSTRI